MRLLEPVAEGGILDVSVERHDALVDAAERSQAGSPRLTRGDEVTLLVGGRRHARVIGLSRLWSTRLRRLDAWCLSSRNQLRLELGDRLVRFFPFLQRLAMPAVFALDRLDPFALDRAGDDRGRTALRRARGCERVEQRLDIVPVDDDRVPAERVPAPLDLRHVVIELCRTALAQTVDVDDGAQIVELVELRDVRRFPHRTFSDLAVAEERIRPVVGLDAPRVQRDADGRTHPLSKGSRGDVHERESWRRMSFQIRVHPAQLELFFTRKKARFGPRGIQDRCGMAFRQHEPVRVRVARILRVVAHLREEQHGDDFGRREAGRGMSAAGFGRRPHAVDAQPRGDVVQCGSGRGSHGNSLNLPKKPKVYHLTPASRTAST